MKKKSREDFGFLPAVLEIIDTPASPTIRMASITICVLFVFALAWAWFGHLDMVAVAQGRLVPSGRVKIIQAPEVAKISAIYVKDGQQVKEGEVLIELDPIDARADFDRISHDLEEARMEAVRLLATLKAVQEEAKDKTAVAVELNTRHQMLLENTLNEYKATIASLIAEDNRVSAERKGIKTEMAKMDASIPLIRQRTEATSNLLKEGYAPKLEVLKDRQALIEAEYNRKSMDDRLAELAAKQISLQEELNRKKAEFKTETAAKLVEAEQKTAGLEQELLKARERLSRRTITSPISGTVQQLAVHTIGGMVQGTQSIMAVVPEGGALEVEAWVQNKDIGFVRAGQHAAVKLETFPFTRYGMLEGEVLDVSQDAVTPQRDKTDEDNSAVTSSETQNAGAVYVAHLKLNRTTMEVDGSTVNLTPGMVVSAEIKTGQRRIMDYLLSPIQKNSQEAMRER